MAGAGGGVGAGTGTGTADGAGAGVGESSSCTLAVGAACPCGISVRFLHTAPEMVDDAGGILAVLTVVAGATTGDPFEVTTPATAIVDPFF